MFEMGNTFTIACHIVNATGWQMVAIYHVVNESSTEIATLDNSTGTVYLHKKKDYAISYSAETDLTVMIGISNVSCNSQGSYVCSITAGSLENPVANVTSTAFVSVVGM